MIAERHVRFAVVGCGHIGKRHAEMISRNEESELVGMCDVKPAGEVDVEKVSL
jgi:predicted dehydrogenase